MDSPACVAPARDPGGALLRCAARLLLPGEVDVAVAVAVAAAVLLVAADGRRTRWSQCFAPRTAPQPPPPSLLVSGWGAPLLPDGCTYSNRITIFSPTDEAVKSLFYPYDRREKNAS